MAEENFPPLHRRLRPNVVRIRPIYTQEMRWFFGGGIQGGVQNAAMMLAANAQPSMKESLGHAFYGLLTPDTVMPSLRIQADWRREDVKDTLAGKAEHAVKSFVAQAGEMNNTIGTAIKGLQTKEAFKVIEAFSNAARVQFGSLGPVTKKIYKRPKIEGQKIKCVYDLSAEQQKLARISIRRLLRMAYPRNDEEEKNASLPVQGLNKVVDNARGLFGHARTYDPFPVELVIGQHFYMSPMVISNIDISSSPDRFIDEKDEGRQPPKTIEIDIMLEEFLLPDPATPWLTYSGYHMMGGGLAGTPYKAAVDAL